MEKSKTYKLILTCIEKGVFVKVNGEDIEIHPYFVNRFAERMEILENPPDKTLVVSFTGIVFVKNYNGLKLLITK